MNNTFKGLVVGAIGASVIAFGTANATPTEHEHSNAVARIRCDGSARADAYGTFRDALGAYTRVVRLNDSNHLHDRKVILLRDGKQLVVPTWKCKGKHDKG